MNLDKNWIDARVQEETFNGNTSNKLMVFVSF